MPRLAVLEINELNQKGQDQRKNFLFQINVLKKRSTKRILENTLVLFLFF